MATAGRAAWVLLIVVLVVAVGGYFLYKRAFAQVGTGPKPPIIISGGSIMVLEPGIPPTLPSQTTVTYTATSDGTIRVVTGLTSGAPTVVDSCFSNGAYEPCDYKANAWTICTGLPHRLQITPVSTNIQITTAESGATFSSQSSELFGPFALHSDASLPRGIDFLVIGANGVSCPPSNLPAGQVLHVLSCPAGRCAIRLGMQ